jgi:hypothetical protein
VSALGKDATNVAGYNLLEPLADMSYITKQGLNAAIYTLIAFDTKDYEIPSVTSGGVQTTREKLVQYILSSELQGGGWSYGDADADPDMTAMVLEALAPYYNGDKNIGSDSEIRAAVERGITVLSDMQNADGSYSSYGSANSNSLAQIITALDSLGINPETDSRFIKNGYSAMDALSYYYVAGQGFLYMEESTAVDDYSLNMIGYALVAHQRMKQNLTPLYRMSDTNSANPSTESTTEQKDNSPQTGDAVPLALVTGLLFCAMAGLVGKRLYVSREGK